MTGNKTFYYNNVFTRSITVNLDEVILSDRVHKLDNRPYMNKMIVILDAYANRYYYHADPFSFIDRAARGVISKDGYSLFFTPGCEVPRDIVRNSGYKITINRDNADFVVIPYKKRNAKYEFDIFAMKDGNAYLFLSKNGEISEKNCNLNDIEAALANEGYTDIIFGCQTSGSQAHFISKFDVYKEIIEQQSSNTKYVYENAISLTPAAELSIETLNIWKNISDDNMRSKLLLASDCQKYPLTTMYFCSKYWWAYLRNKPDVKVKRLFECMDYNPDKSLETNMFVRRMINPEDWNLLCRFIMDELKLPEKGGFISKDLDGTQEKVLRSTLCVAPLFIKEPMMFETIQALK